MSPFCKTLLAALVVALTAPLAGAGETKCDWAVQDCLDAMVTSIKDRGWLGIEYEIDEEKGTSTILKVVPGSPAEEGGFEPGDILLALEDIDLGSSDVDRKAIARIMKPGNTVHYTVSRDGKKKKLAATLAPITKELLAQWVGRHMLEHYDAPEGHEGG